jgi:two-component system, NarL family, sensor histidine kinase DesK
LLEDRILVSEPPRNSGQLIQSAGPIWLPSESSWRFRAPFALLVIAFLADVSFAHAPAFIMCLYSTALSVARFGVRAAPTVAAMAIASLVVPVVIPFWHDSLASAFENVAPVAIPVVGIVTYAVVRVQRTNMALAEARAEIARLAADNERSRIARDLHDLLGHSLTTITLKAGLASRLREIDPERAATEIGAVEDLSRQALAEVRAAVSSYRDVSLASELAQGRELLRASGVRADLPTTTDVG